MIQCTSGSTELLSQLRIQLGESSEDDKNNIESLSSKVDALEKSFAEKNALQDRVDILIVQLAEMKDNFKSCEKELLHKNILIGELENQIASKSEKVFMTELDDLKLQLLQKETNLLERERKAIELERVIENLKSENVIKDTEKDEMEVTKNGLEKELNILKFQNGQLLETIARIDEALNLQVQANEELKSSSDSLRKEISDKSKLIEEIKSKLETANISEPLKLRYEEISKV